MRCRTCPVRTLRICLIYDHLYPQTVGGAERWMRDLATRLAAAGHDVTYLTMQHWPADDPPRLDGVRILGLTEPGNVYRDDRRTLVAPLRFGFAVARHLARHGADYDVVHTGSFPYFPLLGAAASRRRRGYALVVDWYEVWSREYWHRYAGRVVGTIGWLVQKLCVRTRHTAHCMSQLHARRLVEAGYRGPVTMLPGLYAGPTEPLGAGLVDPDLVLYAGRHVREKRVDALVRAFELARRRRPGLRLELYGDGPERPRIETLVRELDLSAAVEIRGRRPEEEVASAMARAACVATASEREGYGLIVVEAAARGTPSVVVADPENAAVELVAAGVNGAVASSASAKDLASAILGVVEAGARLRDSTVQWFVANADRLRIDRSLDLVVEEYARLHGDKLTPGPEARGRGARRS